MYCLHPFKPPQTLKTGYVLLSKSETCDCSKYKGQKLFLCCLRFLEHPLPGWTYSSLFAGLCETFKYLFKFFVAYISSREAVYQYLVVKARESKIKTLIIAYCKLACKLQTMQEICHYNIFLKYTLVYFVTTLT